MTKDHHVQVSDEERAQRAADAARVRASTELEGGRSSDAARAIQDAYVRGEIDADEVVRRTKALHGIGDK